MFMYCLYLPVYSTSLMRCHSKTVLAWQCNVAKNNKNTQIFMKSARHFCLILTKSVVSQQIFIRFPILNFMQVFFRNMHMPPNKCNYISIHLYAVLERGGPTLPFTFQMFIPCPKPHLLLNQLLKRIKLTICLLHFLIQVNISFVLDGGELTLMTVTGLLPLIS